MYLIDVLVSDPCILMYKYIYRCIDYYIQIFQVGSSPAVCADMEDMCKRLLAVPYNAPSPFPPLAQESRNPQLDAFMVRLEVFASQSDVKDVHNVDQHS